MNAAVKKIILIAVFAFIAANIFSQCRIVSSSSSYFEDFNNTNGQWFVASGSVNSDWIWGKPNKTVINSAGSGLNCWMVGGLTSIPYGSNENSYLQSPCFDLSGLTNPYISFNIFWEDEKNFDGSNLQYSVDGITWKIVGSSGEAQSCVSSNWYNGDVRYINSSPGWSGSINKGTDGGNCSSGGGSGGWVLAQHTLPYADIKNATSVRFRFNFGAGTQCNGYDGFAVDDIFIGETPNITPAFITSPANTTACSGNAASFNVSATNATAFEWQVSNNNGSFFTIISNGGIYSGAGTSTLNISDVTGLNTFQYRVKITGQTSACTIMSSVATLSVTGAASITAQPQDKTLCSTSPATFSVTASGNVTGYQWQESADGINWRNITNGGVYSNATTGTLIISNGTGLNGYRYRSVITTACGNIIGNAASLNVQVTEKPQATALVTLCKNDKASSLSATGNQLLWYNLAVGGTGTTNALIPVTTAPGVFNYYVSQTINGCESDRTAIQVKVNSVNIILTSTPDPVLSGESVRLATSGVQPFTIISWLPLGSFSDQLSFSQIITPEKTTLYSVVAQSQEGCIDTFRTNVVVKFPTQDVFIPNAFTPNGDNKNDVLLIYGNNIRSAEMHIFNQWGQEIFVSMDVNKGWDGTSKSKSQPSGVYVFTVKVIFDDGSYLTKKGSVILIR
ncbi:hypothetical protein BH09BAC2_BH09BAC2_19400 [soil metagenome]